MDDVATKDRSAAGTGPAWRPLAQEKFRDPFVTAKGERRAGVDLVALRTLWFNTGTLCNITCANCYIESSPHNDRLAYLSHAELTTYLDEIARDKLPTEEIGFTGGEPFMNPDILSLIETSLARGFGVLVLTNAMRPMQRLAAPLADLNRRHGAALTIRVSLDHYTRERHEAERGRLSWERTIKGMQFLAANGFNLAVAGRANTGESEAVLRAGYAALLQHLDIALDTDDPARLVLFPEMDARVDVPEITESCWGILHKSPQAVMCSSSRMVVKRKGAARPSVVACTLLPYAPQFELGATLAEAAGAVMLNHPHCAKFCVLGGASCSRG
jgi:uncharacterized Fe-S cluster-containing radical SAM superfamily protein